MAETVQSFIETLRANGVEAGRKEAERIRREAEEKAEQIVRDAESKARQIVEEAEREREKTLERTQTDLKLAARDTVAKLRDSLSQAVNRVLAQKVSETFDDETFLKELIRDMALNYAKSDAAGEEAISFNLSQPMQKKLADWIVATLQESSGGDQLSVELHGTLTSAGFEYKVSGGTVEVTPESVVEALSQIVTPQLQQLITADEEKQTGEQA